MFDRCHPDTSRVIDTALDDARGFGHTWLGTEHVLVSFAKHRQLLPGGVAALLPDEKAVIAALATSTAQPARGDSELLRVVGVDLDRSFERARREADRRQLPAIDRPRSCSG